MTIHAYLKTTDDNQDLVLDADEEFILLKRKGVYSLLGMAWRYTMYTPNVLSVFLEAQELCLVIEQGKQVKGTRENHGCCRKN